ncbi:MAG: DUF1492 domain-containing protein [Ruminiclostridium sp.]
MNMNIKDFLARHKTADAEINSKLEQLSELKSLATKITPSTNIEGRGSGNVSDRVGRTVAKIVDLEQEINEAIDRLVDIKREIEDLINLLDDSVMRTVLERRYLLHENWEVIAEKMGYSCRHITRLHIQALEELQRLKNAAEPPFAA